MNPEMEVTIKAYQVLEKFVKPSGNSGRVYVPKNGLEGELRCSCLNQ